MVIGETGVPFDLNNGTAFKTGDFKWQERMMDAICSALEENLVSYKYVSTQPTLIDGSHFADIGIIEIALLVSQLVELQPSQR